MGTWGTGNFENDAALDFINMEVDRHVSAIEDIFSDEERFRLDEDAEGELIPRVEMLLALCGHCGGVLQEKLDTAAWKARYLAMYDDQIDGMEPTDGYKKQRRAVIADTFDRLIAQHKKQWQRLAE
jgi:cytochrome P450